MVEVLFILFVSLSGQPFVEAARYGSADECKTAIETLQVMELSDAGEPVIGEVRGACLAYPRPRPHAGL